MKTQRTLLAVALAALASATTAGPAFAADPNAPTAHSTTLPDKPGVTSNTGTTNGALPSPSDPRARGANAVTDATGAADAATGTGTSTRGTTTRSTANGGAYNGAGAASNTNSVTGPQTNNADRTYPANADGTPYRWWQKEWWQQQSRNNRITREQYMDQMGRRWDAADTQKRGYMTPDEVARAFGDETTVAPAGATPNSTAGGAGMPGAAATRSGLPASSTTGAVKGQ